MLFEFLTPEYVKTKLDLIDLSLTGLRDAIRGTGNKTLTDLDADLTNIYSRLDVALSTRASESTLSAFSGKFPSAVALADNLGNPTTTIIGVANLGWDGTYWRRVAVDTSSRFKIALDADNIGLLKDTKIPNPLGVLTSLDVIGTTTNALAVISQTLPARQPYTITGIAVSTTEGSTSISAPGAKILVIKNQGDVDVQIGINGTVPTTNPLIVRARTVKVITHKGITQVNYKVASGSSTIDLEYYN
jgi:hypothetical protein